MKFRNGLMAALLAMLTTIVSAQSPTIFDGARFEAGGGDEIELLGFGRGGSGAAAMSSLPMDLTPSFAKMANLAEERVEFYDLWRVKVQDGVAPGIYSFKDVEINVVGTLLFDFVLFNSIDATGNLLTTKFKVTEGGTSAVGSGVFAVRPSCADLPSCIYIQVFGTQAAGDLSTDGYGDPGGISLIATPVPEPATWAVLAMGLAVVGSIVRRRARA